ncbi:hypothetical protein [Streptomyces sp. 7N604]
MTGDGATRNTCPTAAAANGRPPGMRVTVGSPEANDLLIAAAKETAPPAR